MFEVLHLEERNHKARGNQICYSLSDNAKYDGEEGLSKEDGG